MIKRKILPIIQIILLGIFIMFFISCSESTTRPGSCSSCGMTCAYCRDYGHEP